MGGWPDQSMRTAAQRASAMLTGVGGGEGTQCVLHDWADHRLVVDAFGVT